MFRLLSFVAVLATSVVTPVAAGERNLFVPSIGVDFRFGNTAPSKTSNASVHLSVTVGQFGEDYGVFSGKCNTACTAITPHLRLEFDSEVGYTLRIFGNSVAGYRYANYSGDGGILGYSDEKQNIPGSWISENWWKVGLGFVVVGATVLAAGGGDGGDASETSPSPSCQVGSGNIGPVVSPGAPCPST